MSKETYLEQRLKQMALTQADISIPLVEVTHLPNGERQFTCHENEKHTFFLDEKDAEGNLTGNIEILYFNEHGGKSNYLKPGTKWPRQFKRRRIANPEEGKPKYLAPEKSSLAPFFTPKVIHAFIKKEKIKTLVFTEGEFKAIKGDQQGIYIIGLPGIQGFYGELPGQIHYSIVNVIKQCQVENIIYLTDADTFTVNWNKDKKDKDLSFRPSNFHSAVYKFRESLEFLLSDKDVQLEKVFFYSIKKRFDKEGAKGLDDLLCAYPARTPDIVKDLAETYGSPGEFFTGDNLTAWNTVSKKLYKSFGLNNVDDFYELYKENLGDQEFVYKGKRYQWNGEKVEYLRHEDADKYFRVGPDWYKEVEEPAGTKFVKTIVKWTSGAIKEDYKNHRQFMDQLTRFDGFTVWPEWTGKYRRKIGSFLNLMNPLEHVPKEGEFPATRKFLKHIFGGQGEFDKDLDCDTFTIALDWLSLLYLHPRQMLPSILLVSEEQGTGKTTFMDWLVEIYTSNAIIMNNEMFAMSFNAHYASKFLIMVDEGMLEVDKKKEKERLKQLITGKEIMMQFKGRDVKRMPFFGKVVICSNDADRVMKMEDEDSRFFVVKVSKIKQKDKDPKLLEKLRKEIPAFLHFLKERAIHHKNVDRLWFSPDQFITEQFRIIVENTKDRKDKVIESFLRETFLTFREKVLRIPNKQLVEQINKTAKYKLDETDLRDYLKKKGIKTNPNGSQRYKFPLYWQKSMTDTKQMEIVYLEDVGRYIEFRAEDWLSKENLEEFSKPLQVTVLDEHGQPKNGVQLGIGENSDKDELPF